VTGFGGALLSAVPGTAAFSVARRLDTIKANIGFSQLQRMRESSPTGGALGQITERELAFLQATLGSLEQAEDVAEFKTNLERLKEVYLDIIHGPGNRPGTETTAEPGVGTLDLPQPGDIVDGFRFKGGHAGDQNNWEPVQ
jgi:hypothetical protein